MIDRSSEIQAPVPRHLRGDPEQVAELLNQGGADPLTVNSDCALQFVKPADDHAIARDLHQYGPPPSPLCDFTSGGSLLHGCR